jgi:hypothetical protein
MQKPATDRSSAAMQQASFMPFPRVTFRRRSKFGDQSLFVNQQKKRAPVTEHAADLAIEKV